MLNNDKIKIMTKLALYEQKGGKKDFAGGKYYRSDYVSLGMINSAIVATIAFILILACVVLVNIETLLTTITSFDFVKLGSIIVVIYLLYLLLYLTITYIIYRLRYDKIKGELKNYDNNLKALYTIYKEEENAVNDTAEIKKENMDIAIMEES